jgi:MFS family permease
MKVESFSLGKALHTRQLWFICMAEVAVFFCLFTTIVHIIPHARDMGLQAQTAAAVLSIIGGVSMLGRLVMGWANDRIGGKRSLFVCLLLLNTSLVLLLLAGNMGMLFVFAVIYGFAHGGLFTVISPTVAELFGTASHGALFGLIWFCGTLGGAIGPWLTGYLIDTTGSYHVAFLILIAFGLMGLVLIGVLRPLNPAGH